jgi:hypothetical protein
MNKKLSITFLFFLFLNTVDGQEITKVQKNRAIIKATTLSFDVDSIYVVNTNLEDHAIIKVLKKSGDRFLVEIQSGKLGQGDRIAKFRKEELNAKAKKSSAIPGLLTPALGGGYYISRELTENSEVDDTKFSSDLGLEAQVFIDLPNQWGFGLSYLRKAGTFFLPGGNIDGPYVILDSEFNSVLTITALNLRYSLEDYYLRVSYGIAEFNTSGTVTTNVPGLASMSATEDLSGHSLRVGLGRTWSLNGRWVLFTEVNYDRMYWKEGNVRVNFSEADPSEEDVSEKFTINVRQNIFSASALIGYSFF